MLSRRDLLASAAIGLATRPGIAAPSTSSAAPSNAGSQVVHRQVDVNGIHIHLAEQGEGPLVLLCHGFPESWYAWRWQLPALAAAGFHAVALDMRGYGQTTAPSDVADYTRLHFTGDVVGIVHALHKRQAVIVGHDWGAVVAWDAAMLRPDIFPGVAALSVPFLPRGPTPPLRQLRQAGLYNHYWLYFQDPGVAETEFERDPRDTLARLLAGKPSGSVPAGGVLMLQPGKGLLDNIVRSDALPPWLTDDDLDHMSVEFARTGFRGGLNYYRNLDRDWELLAAWDGVGVRQPALFIAGKADSYFSSAVGQATFNAMQTSVPGLQRTLLLDGVGHWTQQESPKAVNAALIQFVKNVDIS